LALSLMATTGCATLTGSSTEMLSVVSNPAGAEVRVNGMPTGRTPTQVEVDKKRTPTIEVLMPGYAPATCPVRMRPGTGYVVADTALCIFLFPVGCISFLDGSGAWNELENGVCSVNLQPPMMPATIVYPQPAVYPPQYPAPQQPQYPPQAFPPVQVQPMQPAQDPASVPQTPPVPQPQG